MRLSTTLLLAFALLTSSACAAGENRSAEAVGVGGPPVAQDATTTASSAQTAVPASKAPAGAASGSAGPAAGSMTTMVDGRNPPAAADGQNAPTERRIIRNATLTVETDDPAAAQRKVSSVAEQHGGYVVTSESRQHTRAGQRATTQVVTVEVRVPSAQFDAVLGAIRGFGGRIADEKVTGLDVTEEYIDLEARVRTQKALEAQIMEIMKRADTVSEALEVQTQLAAVRTEIERIEGRRRFLENQSSLSTIKVTLQPPSPFVEASTGGFLAGLREAFGDGIDFGASFLLGVIRVLIALTPVVLFVFLPLGLLARYILRRRRRRILAQQLGREAAAAETR
ncbi:MAG TPA: DUF4349 domain-containing protein [Pyrinomonadaceae bacterium]|nr:DUF4349 domain-containing protein [Pyrinomonadaceae bacterium]